MQVRECCSCDGLFNVRDLAYVGKDSNHSNVLCYICADCLEIKWALTGKKFPFGLTSSTGLGINSVKSVDNVNPFKEV